MCDILKNSYIVESFLFKDITSCNKFSVYVFITPNDTFFYISYSYKNTSIDRERFLSPEYTYANISIKLDRLYEMLNTTTMQLIFHNVYDYSFAYLYGDIIDDVVDLDTFLNDIKTVEKDAYLVECLDNLDALDMVFDNTY